MTINKCLKELKKIHGNNAYEIKRMHNNFGSIKIQSRWELYLSETPKNIALFAEGKTLQEAFNNLQEEIRVHFA